MELPQSFTDNLDFIADGLHGRPINTDFCTEWKIGAANTNLLLEYMVKTGIVEVLWMPEQQEFCYAKTGLIKDIDALSHER